MISPVRPDLVLINPSSRKRVYQSLANDLAAIEPPVWAGLMATYVHNRGLGVELIDAEALEIDAIETAKIAVELKPLLIAIVAYGHQPSASTQIMPSVQSVCNEIKKINPEQKVLLVGGHVAALANETLQEEQADFTCHGEGLETLIELCNAIKTKSTDYDKVSDLCYRSNGKVLSSSVRAPLVQNVDQNMATLPWDRLPMQKYRAHNWHCLGEVGSGGNLNRSPYVAIYTTLGCPFKCSFCCIQAPFKSGEMQIGMKATTNSYRFWSPQLVGDTLQNLVENYGVKNVKFADEMFVLNRRHVEGICDEIINRRLDLNIWAYARVDTVKEGMLPKLKKAGFNWLAFGIEAANASVRDNVQKGFDQEDISRTLKDVWNQGINVIGNYIFGLPEDNHNTMQETLDLAIDLNCEFSNFYCAMAYPGSALYLQAIENKWQLPHTWGGYSQHSVDSLPLPTKYLTAGEVLQFRDNAFMKYYTNSKYLEMIDRKFGQDSVNHIQQMTSIKLERKYIDKSTS